MHGDFVLRIDAAVPDLDLAAWLHANRDEVLALLDRHGAVLLRGFVVNGPAGFGTAAQALVPELLDYRERAAPRSEVADRVFTSTELPADQTILQHHEMSYAHQWPGRLFFYCETPPAGGGATPLASERQVYPAIPPEIRQRFLRDGVCYVRNYGPDLDLPWPEVFQTTDRSEVEAYCRGAAMQCEWLGGGRLRTRAVRQAVARHPRTGETVWFNHSHLFHVSSLPPEIAAALIREFGIDGLPRNACYGDGRPIPDDEIGCIRELYQSAAVTFAWQPGDVLVVDNFLATHGREPFRGDRRVLVAMSGLHGENAP
jgi:alpha-ketoglutarate-dependent taurine dioxygenase